MHDAKGGTPSTNHHRHNHRYLPLPDDNDEDNLAIIDDAVGDVIAAAASSNNSLASALQSLSRRGQRAALPPTPAHWAGFISCLQDPCDALHNPEGHIALCLAENKLVQEMLANRLMNSDTAVGAFRNPIVYGYNGFLGLPATREAVAYLLERRFLFAEGRRRRAASSDFTSSVRDDDDLDATARMSNTSRHGQEEVDGDDDGFRSSDTIVPQARPSSPGPDPDRIDPDHCALGAGVASLLSHVLFILSQPSDVILIPAPYYSSFENDLQALAATVPWPVHMANPHLGPTVVELEAAALQAEREGLSVRALLITNPNDPLGVVYRPTTITNAWNGLAEGECTPLWTKSMHFLCTDPGKLDLNPWSEFSTMSLATTSICCMVSARILVPAGSALACCIRRIRCCWLPWRI